MSNLPVGDGITDDTDAIKRLRGDIPQTSEFKPISTAPKDGRPINCMNQVGMEFEAQWRDHDKTHCGPGWIDNLGKYRDPIKWSEIL